VRRERGAGYFEFEDFEAARTYPTGSSILQEISQLTDKARSVTRSLVVRIARRLHAAGSGLSVIRRQGMDQGVNRHHGFGQMMARRPKSKTAWSPLSGDVNDPLRRSYRKNISITRRRC